MCLGLITCLDLFIGGAITKMRSFLVSTLLAGTSALAISSPPHTPSTVISDPLTSPFTPASLPINPAVVLPLFRFIFFVVFDE